MHPIRILHVVTYMGRGGLETMIMNYYRHIDRNKVQFDFLVHRDFRADYDDEIESLGGKIYRLPKLVPWNMHYRNALESFFIQHREYKIVHVHQDCLSSIILKAAQKHGVPVRIAHSHNSSQDKNLKYLIKLFYRRQIPGSATELFACGKEAGDWMFRGAPYHIVNNAIDTKRYVFNQETRDHLRRVLNIDSETFVVGHVGRFNAVKNHAFLLEVFAKVKSHNAKSLLLLVGDGVLRNDLESKVASLKLSDSVIFTGVRSDVADLMQAMDCFVFPSFYEGLPLTLIEAQAAGLPCLVSDGVSMECDKTGLVDQISLRNSADVWAERTLQLAESVRYNTTKDIVRSGYDIAANAQWLQNFYSEQWKEA